MWWQQRRIFKPNWPYYPQWYDYRALCFGGATAVLAYFFYWLSVSICLPLRHLSGEWLAVCQGATRTAILVPKTTINRAEIITVAGSDYFDNYLLANTACLLAFMLLFVAYLIIVRLQKPKAVKIPLDRKLYYAFLRKARTVSLGAASICLLMFLVGTPMDKHYTKQREAEAAQSIKESIAADYHLSEKERYEFYNEISLRERNPNVKNYNRYVDQYQTELERLEQSYNSPTRRFRFLFGEKIEGNWIFYNQIFWVVFLCSALIAACDHHLAVKQYERQLGDQQ